MTEASARVKVNVGTESYIFDRNDLSLTDLYAIKAASGLNANPFLQGVAEADPLALQTLVWFCRYKAGIQQDRLQVEFKMGDYSIEAVSPEADPTGATSGTPDASTSESSPTSAT